MFAWGFPAGTFSGNGNQLAKGYKYTQFQKKKNLEWMKWCMTMDDKSVSAWLHEHIYAAVKNIIIFWKHFYNFIKVSIN